MIQTIRLAFRIQLALVGAALGTVEAVHKVIREHDQAWANWSESRIQVEVDKTVDLFEKEFHRG